jgi:hypothetical protein
MASKNAESYGSFRKPCEWQSETSGQFERNTDVIAMLEDPVHWPPASGLYFVMQSGVRFTNNKRMQIQPYYGNNQQEIVGLWASFLGFEFVMMVAAPDREKSPALKQWMHRPRRIEITMGRTKRFIQLSWVDRLKHSNISASFERSVS